MNLLIISVKFMGQDASIMKETLLAWKSRVVKMWLRYGWDYTIGESIYERWFCLRTEEGI